MCVSVFGNICSIKSKPTSFSRRASFFIYLPYHWFIVLNLIIFVTSILKFNLAQLTNRNIYSIIVFRLFSRGRSRLHFNLINFLLLLRGLAHEELVV